MILDLLIFVGAALGAWLNRAAGKHVATWDWQTVAEVLGPASALVMLASVVGLLPDEVRAALSANPLRVGITAFFIALVMGPGLVTMAKSVYFRVTNGGRP